MIDEETISRIESGWSEETGGIFTEDNPAKNQCFVTSLVVNDLIGGTFAFMDSPRHLWNIAPNGTHIDLTRQQFAGEEVDFSNYIVISRDNVFEIARGHDLESRYKVLWNYIHVI